MQAHHLAEISKQQGVKVLEAAGTLKQRLGLDELAHERNSERSATKVPEQREMLVRVRRLSIL
jgi:hypothetical protein